MITLYTDGSALLADQSGGWAWWVSDEFYDAGHVTPATNNQMEMLAVTRGLTAVLGHGEDVMVVSDSMYVIGCFTQRWHVNWRRNTDMDGRWRTGTGKRVANQDLWEELVELVEAYPTAVTWKHCRGHGRGGPEDAPYVEGNDKVDRLAGEARKALVVGRPYEYGTAGAARMSVALTKKKRTRRS